VAGSRRDPLSVHYDGYVADLMTRARRASEQRRGVLAWISSPRGEFRVLDQGGRTRHERAFTRSAYYLVFKIEPGQWGHLKLTWGDTLVASSKGKLARPVVVRLYRSARVEGPRWVDGYNRHTG
jgi:hypothetical protein